MQINGEFTFASVTTDKLIEQYGVLLKGQRSGLTPDQKALFVAIKDELMDSRLQLIEITPEPEHEDLAKQLVGQDESGNWRDKVHSVGVENLEEAYRLRIGGGDANKTVYALVHPEHPQGRKVMAAIYLNKRDGLANNVHEILTSEIKAANGYDYVAAYSISSFGVMPGEGQFLIFALHRRLNQVLPEHVKITTLSPFRTFARHLSQTGVPITALSADEQKTHAVNYVRTNGDPVGKFHRGNGAIALEIHGDANVQGSEDHALGHGLMINYFYPRPEEQLAYNMSLYTAGQFDVLMSPRLRERAGLPRVVEGMPRFETLK